MSSVQSLREFISERLTAAAEEIFKQFEKTIVQYEEEMDRQRRLLDYSRWKRNTNNIADIPAFICKEFVVNPLSLNHQKGSEEPELKWIKEEQPQLGCSQDWKQLGSETEVDLSAQRFSGSEIEPKAAQLHFLDSPLIESQGPDLESAKNLEIKEEMSTYGESSSSSWFCLNDVSSNKSVNCEICGKTLKDKYSMKQHLRIHSGVRPYICRTCGKSFTQKGNLLSHVRIHTGEKLFCCETCGKSFTCSSNLSVHRRTHTGEKLFPCRTCGRRFSQKCNLLSHMRTHTGEKLFTCDTCGRSFMHRSHLSVHRKIHTGEKSFCCKTCGKGFTQNGNLSAHMRTHTDERPFRCGACGRTFKRKTHLRVHLRTHKDQVFFCTSTS
uniref:C2H2-type domain-containing protein n=1 Tax=Oryzias sinensis TaxID=183150 RepID=A0A8C7ZXN9_9TELE